MAAFGKYTAKNIERNFFVFRLVFLKMVSAVFLNSMEKNIAQSILFTRLDIFEITNITVTMNITVLSVIPSITSKKNKHQCGVN